MIRRPSISSARMINTWSRWVLFILPPKCIPISPPSLHQNLLTGLHADFPASGAFSTLQSEVPCFKFESKSGPCQKCTCGLTVPRMKPKPADCIPKGSQDWTRPELWPWAADPSVTMLLFGALVHARLSAFLTRSFQRVLLFPLAWPEMTSTFSRKELPSQCRRLESSLRHLETPCLCLH